MRVLRFLVLLPLVALVAAARTPFKYRSYDEMASYLQELATKYPEVVRLSVAQETYTLPAPKKLTCGATSEPCKHFVVHLTNHSTLPDARRPEVFISGALHGDERVGPTTTVELIAFLADGATAYARGERGDAQVAATRRWLHELVNMRSVVLTPMTNAFGYAHNVRGELGVDPNRDYNYLREPHECMTTMTSRVVNEIWREHLFQLAITFHGGMRAVSYEWGSPDHYLRHNRQRSEKSPDHRAQARLAALLAGYAGAFADGELYPTGTMNDVVYGVTGGMEDWAYAASWENAFERDGAQKPFQPCKPATFGGYPAEKTMYNNLTHRAFNMLIETSNDKQPTETTLGAVEDIYAAELDYFRAQPGFKAGHVTQNVRLALMMIEMVQPYVRWVGAGSPAATDGLEPEAFRPASLYVESAEELTAMGCGGFAAETAAVASCSSTTCRVPRANGSEVAKIQLAWEVLGAFIVNKTHVELSTSADFKAEAIVHKSTVQTGTTRRAFAFTASEEDTENTDTLGTSLFVACVDLKAAYGKQLFVRAVTTVDQDWASQGVGDEAPSPRIPPQSHVVNARTNPSWDAEWNGHRVQGSLDWYSSVITVEIEDAQESTNTTASVTLPAADSAATAKKNDTAGSGSRSHAKTSGLKMTPSPKLSAAVAAGVAPSSFHDDDDIDSYFVSEVEHTDKSAGDDDDVRGDNDGVRDDNASNSGKQEDARTPVPTTAKPRGAPSPTLVTKNEMLSANANAETKSEAQSSSLRSFGLLVIGSGGLVILVTLAFLYRRVFRSRRQHYMNINSQRQGMQQQQQPAVQHAVAAGEGDDDEDEESV
ncbi:hypothetical protein PybrP1_005327 [[Pythium] brassicae (nom. inval.)]|nr:hypothetical protein PybrP1_005327 [[Pythium] brassicae (nom. inval.)]